MNAAEKDARPSVPSDADLDALVFLIRVAERGGCGSHQGCRDLVAKKKRDAARRWFIDRNPTTPHGSATDQEANRQRTPQQPRPHPQAWERRLAGTPVTDMALHLLIDDQGRAYVHEAVLAQLLTDAGWERTT